MADYPTILWRFLLVERCSKASGKV
jgi:hypothetical protein